MIPNRMRDVRRRALSATALGVLAWSGAAAAQPAGDSRSASTVQEIIVTAQKRAENVQNVPLSVTPTTGKELERLHIINLEGLNGPVPNLQVAENGGLALASMISIRGIGEANNPQVYAGTEVATVVDGVVQGTAQFNLASQFDLERVEILAGPQGTLFGANTTAGVVNVVTRQPTGEFGGYGAVTLGNYNRFDAWAAINFPIIQDVLSGKIAFSHQGRDGFYTNDFNGSKIDNQDNNTVRLYLKWTPNADLDVTLQSQYQNLRIGSTLLDNNSYPGEVFYVPGHTANFHIYDNIQTPNTLTTQSHTITANWHSPIGTLTSITNYQDYRNTADIDYASIDCFCMLGFGYGKGWQASQELRDVFHPTSNVEALVGLFAESWRSHGDAITLVPFASTQGFSRGIQDERTTDVSGFTQIYWDVTKRLRLNAGVRVAWDDVALYRANYNYASPQGVTANLGFNNLNGSQLLPLPVGNEPNTGRKQWVNVGGKIGADYHVTDEAMVYGFYARGFKSGGFNGSVTVQENIGPYNPEYVDSFELGLKSQWLDRRLQVNLAAFLNKWKNMQVEQFTFSDPTTLNSQILNAGRATTKGVELQVQAVPIHGLHLEGTLGYLSAQYDQFNSTPNALCPPAPQVQPLGCAVSYAGRDLPYAPHWTGSLSGTYDFDLFTGTAETSVQYTYSDAKWGNYTQAISEALPAVGLLNGNVSWTPPNGSWTIALWGRNLLNKTYFASALDAPPLFTEAVLGNPREWGVDFKFKF